MGGGIEQRIGKRRKVRKRRRIDQKSIEEYRRV